jgi:hypothetical protein
MKKLGDGMIRKKKLWIQTLSLIANVKKKIYFREERWSSVTQHVKYKVITKKHHQYVYDTSPQVPRCNSTINFHRKAANRSSEPFPCI